MKEILFQPARDQSAQQHPEKKDKHQPHAAPDQLASPSRSFVPLVVTDGGKVLARRGLVPIVVMNLFVLHLLLEVTDDKGLRGRYN